MKQSMFLLFFTLFFPLNFLYAKTCEDFGNGKQTGLLFSDLVETSGLSYSIKNKDIFWSHNDSGDSARFFAFNEKGEKWGEFTLKDAKAVDWEDMATSPCFVNDSCLYFGDVGDNSETRTSITVFRVKEPVVDETTRKKTQTLVDFDTFVLKYPDKAHNAEILLVHPKTQDIFIVTKTLSTTSEVFKLSGSSQPGTHTLLKVGTLQTKQGLLTGGAFSPQGDLILLRGYSFAFVYKVDSDGYPKDSLLLRSLTLLPVQQGEAISFDATGSFFLTTTERLPSPIHKYSCLETVKEFVEEETKEETKEETNSSLERVFVEDAFVENEIPREKAIVKEKVQESLPDLFSLTESSENQGCRCDSSSAPSLTLFFTFSFFCIFFFGKNRK